jgi:hypothetical protein
MSMAAAPGKIDPGLLGKISPLRWPHLARNSAQDVS